MCVLSKKCSQVALKVLTNEEKYDTLNLMRAQHEKENVSGTQVKSNMGTRDIKGKHKIIYLPRFLP